MQSYPNKLCKSGDIYCKHRYGEKSYCAFQNRVPTCYNQDFNDTGDNCTCIKYDEQKDSPMFYISLCLVILLTILFFLSIPSEEPIENQLQFMLFFAFKPIKPLHFVIFLNLAQ